MTQKLYETPKIWLTLDVCARIFEKWKDQLEFNEPIPPFDERFSEKLESILSSVSQSYSGAYLNATVLDAAAAYFDQIIRGHPFKNGNKRMAVLFTHYFLLVHRLDYTLYYNEMFTFAVFIARAGEKGIPDRVTKKLCRDIISKFTKEWV